MIYTREVTLTDAITGKILKVFKVESPTPLSGKAAIHAVIQHEDKGGK